MRSESPEFLIDQWQQLLGGLRVAVLDALEDLGDVAHARQSSGLRSRNNCKENPAGEYEFGSPKQRQTFAIFNDSVAVLVSNA